VTLEEAKVIAKSVLTDEELKKLKVKGPVKPHSGSALKSKVTFEKPLAAIDANEMRGAFSKILNDLAALHGFWISEPDPVLKTLGYGVETASHGNLRLHFVSMFDSRTLDMFTHVVCWYHLAESE
jgi:hypothetical protein